MAKSKKKKMVNGQTKTNRKKIVTAFTYVNSDQCIPQSFVVGELAVSRVGVFDYLQYTVDDEPVDETTITRISTPTASVIRMLKRKRQQWEREDKKLINSRGRQEDRFWGKKNKDGDREILDDQWEALRALWDKMVDENRRLTAERRAEVAELVNRFKSS